MRKPEYCMNTSDSAFLQVLEVSVLPQDVTHYSGKSNVCSQASWLSLTRVRSRKFSGSEKEGVQPLKLGNLH